MRIMAKSRAGTRKLMPLWYVLAIVLLASGCATSPSSGIKLPDDVKVEPPKSSVPAKRAAFSGRWEGIWDGNLPHLLVVEEVTSDEAMVVYAWGSTGQLREGYSRVKAKFKDDDTLIATLQRPATATYVMQPDGTLNAVYEWSGGVARAKMRRAPAPAAAGSLNEGEVRVGKLTVPDSVRAGSYTVIFEGVEKADPSILVTAGCFYWSGEGPYCSPVASNPSPGTIPVGLVTRNPNTYRLTGYLTYWWKGEIRKSNQASATLRVVP